MIISKIINIIEASPLEDKMIISKIINIIEASPMNQYLVRKEFSLLSEDLEFRLDFKLKGNSPVEDSNLKFVLKSNDSKIKTTSINTNFGTNIPFNQALKEAAFYTAVLNLIQQIVCCFNEEKLNGTTN